MLEICAGSARPKPWRIAKRTARVLLRSVVKKAIAMLMYRAPGVQSALWKLTPKGKVDYSDPELRAVALEQMAFTPVIKGNFSSRWAQTVAFSTIARCAMAQQVEWFTSVFRSIWVTRAPHPKVLVLRQSK